MPVTRLSDTKLKALIRKLPADRTDHFDETFPAFGIRISSTGVASWFVFYRVDGKQVRDIIGRYPAKGLAEARDEARERLRLVDKGKDPRQEEARQRAAETKRRAETFGAVADQYHEAHLSKLASGEELWQRVNDDLMPEWQDTPIRDVTRGEVMALLDRIEKAKGLYARNRRLALIRSMMNFALHRELVDANVAARIKMLDEPDRARVLSDAELVEIWTAAEKLADPFRRFTRMLIVTGQRRREVSDMGWAEVAEAEKLWTIPAERMKARELHELPLPDLAMTLLEPPADDGGEEPERGEKPERGTYIFSTGRRGDRPISAFNKLKVQLDRHLLAARRKADRKAKAMPEWRLHDIRRTVRTGLANLKVRPDVAERILAHTPSGVEAVYDRAEYREAKREALETWAKHVERILNPQPNVIEMSRPLPAVAAGRRLTP
jgi:integrase